MIGVVVLTIDVPLMALLCIWVLILFLGMLRNNLQLLDPLLKVSTNLLPMYLQRLLGFILYSMNSKNLQFQSLLLCGVTVLEQFNSLLIQFFILMQSTLNWTVILCIANKVFQVQYIHIYS